MTEPLTAEEIARFKNRALTVRASVTKEVSVPDWDRLLAIAEDHARLVEDYNDLQREHIDTTECFQLAMRDRDALRTQLDTANTDLLQYAPLRAKLDEAKREVEQLEERIDLLTPDCTHDDHQPYCRKYKSLVAELDAAKREVEQFQYNYQYQFDRAEAANARIEKLIDLSNGLHSSTCHLQNERRIGCVCKARDIRVLAALDEESDSE